MLTKAELQQIAQARLKDAESLFRAKRYDGAVYLCGYAVEIALKARICKTLRWRGYPSRGEFGNYQSFRTHSLDILLHLSGSERNIKKKFFAEWSAVATWDPEARYKPIGTATRQDVQLMIDSARTLLGTL